MTRDDRPDQPGEPTTRIDLTAVNGCVDIADDGTTTMLLWDATTAIVLHCGTDSDHTAALGGAHILTQVGNRLQLELRERVEQPDVR